MFINEELNWIITYCQVQFFSYKELYFSPILCIIYTMKFLSVVRTTALLSRIVQMNEGLMFAKQRNISL